jgi:hypothetical protein
MSVGSAGSANPQVLARELNKFLVGRGGEEIEGLEKLDPKKLIQLRDGLKGFLDQFDKAAQSNPALAQLANTEAVKGLRDLAKFASEQVDQVAVNGGGQRAGFCGGGGGGAVQQPRAPTAPPVVQPEQPNNNNMVTGPLAANGSNFDPLAISACAAAALMAGALLSGTGVATPNAVAQPQAANNGNTDAASTAGRAQPQAVDGASGSDPNLDALKGAGGGGCCFEDRVFALMCKVVEDMQKKIEERLKKLEEEAKKAEQGGGKKGGKGGGIGGALGGIVGAVAPIAGAAIGGPVGGMVGSMVGQAAGGAMSGGGGGGAGGKGGASGQESRNIEFEKIKFDMQKLSQMQQAMSNVLNTMDELAKSAIRHIKAG